MQLCVLLATVMKLFLRFFLSICLLLLGWNGGVHARAEHLLRDRVAIATHTTQMRPVTTPQGGYQQVMRQGIPADDDEDDALEDAEDEKDDRDDESPFGKHLHGRSYFSSCFFCSLTAYCTPGNSSCSSFYKHFSFSSADTYIVFRVIRV